MPGDQPIPVATLLQVRGGWEWYEQCFRLRSTNSDAFCWMCNATQHTVGPLHYRDFREDAPYKQTAIHHQEYLEGCAREGAQPSHLFGIPGFQLDFLTVDVMHAGDLGSFQDAIGSLL